MSTVSWLPHYAQLTRKYTPSSPVGLAAIQELGRTMATDFARMNFRHFVRLVMPQYEWARHNLALAQALQMVAAGTIRRLIVMMPPRHGKTELCSVQFPAFLIGQNPRSRVVLASYSSALSVLNSRKVRDMCAFNSDFDRVFPGIHLNEKKASEREWETLNGGGLLAVGVGGGLTGRGADLLVIDDPIKDAEEASSATIRGNIYDWYGTVARTRLQPGGRIVIVMTPWHEQDLVHRLMREARSNEDAEGWWVLRLPGLAEDDDPLGRERGEALWPARYPADDLRGIRAVMGDYFDALYQCRPRSEAGKKFDRAWFKIVDAPTFEFSKVCRSWDLAVTEDEGSDYTVGTLVGGREVDLSSEQWQRLERFGFERPIQSCVVHVERFRAEWPDARQRIYELAQQDGRDVPIVLEKTRLDLAAVQDLKRDLKAAGYIVHTRQPKGDKVARAHKVSVAASTGRVELVRGSWVEAWLDEHDLFPQVDHDDQVDSHEQGFYYLSKGGFRIE